MGGHLGRLRKTPGGGGHSELIASNSDPSADVGAEGTDNTSSTTSSSGSGDAANTAEKSQVTRQLPLTNSAATSAQTKGEVALSPEAARASLGTIVVDGLTYEVNPDGASVALVGWHGTAPTGDLSIPSQVTSGADTYTVTALKSLGGGGHSLTLP
ncbi:hypothetical protein [Gordonibacter sp. KGMB07426]|uniref:hypothetical protein n=1 Tax=Gordonibacter sp. KGMB07426 TaxID=3404046 RepID=UPI003B28B414